MSSWIYKFIACIFLIIGGGIFYESIWGNMPKGPSGFNSLSTLGVFIVFIGVLIFVWATRRK